MVFIAVQGTISKLHVKGFYFWTYKSSVKYPLHVCVCPFVRSVFPEHLVETFRFFVWSYLLFSFWSDRGRFFEKILFWNFLAKRAKNAPKMRICKFSDKLKLRIFLFYIGYSSIKASNLPQKYFERNLVLRCLDLKVPKNGPKMRCVLLITEMFNTYYQRSTNANFLIFCIKLQ